MTLNTAAAATQAPITYSGQLKRTTFSTPSNGARAIGALVAVARLSLAGKLLTAPPFPPVRNILQVKRIGQSWRPQLIERRVIEKRRLRHVHRHRLRILVLAHALALD